jgi:hypothetical protein
MKRHLLIWISLIGLSFLPMACMRPLTPVTPIGPLLPATQTSTISPTPSATPTGTPAITATVTPTYTPTPLVTDTPTVSPTCSYYGRPEINFNPYTNSSFTALNGGSYYANQMSIGQATLMSSMVLGCQDSSATGETIYVALYDTASGAREFSSSFVLTNAESLASDFSGVPVSPAVSLPAGTYTMAVIVPAASTNFSLGYTNAPGLVDYGTYAGGAPPSNYSSLAGGSQEPGGGFNNSTLDTLSIYGCP